MPREVTFQDALDVLRAGKAVPEGMLSQFSDLTPDQLDALRDVWPHVPPHHKYTLLGDLAILAEQDNLVSFEAIGRAFLHDADIYVRAGAVKLLSECEDPKLIRVYLDMLAADPDTRGRATGARALGLFVRLGELGHLPPQEQTRIEDRLLAAATGNDRSEVRRAAIESLGWSSRPEVPPLIEAAFDRGEPYWMASALRAMARSGDDAWADQVLTGLVNEDSLVRLAAIQAAGELGLHQTRPMLLRMLEEEDDDEIFAAAIWSLSQLGGPDVRLYLEALLDRLEENGEEDLIGFVEDALDNLAFTEDLAPFEIMAVDEPDLESDDGEDESDEESDGE